MARRRDGSYIIEEFLTTGGTDVKVYTVGPRYAHAEARKSPVVDGKVTRSADGKELRFPVLLSPQARHTFVTVTLNPKPAAGPLRPHMQTANLQTGCIGQSSCVDLCHSGGNLCLLLLLVYSGHTGVVVGCAGEGDCSHGVPGLWAEGVRLRPAALRARQELRVRCERLVLCEKLCEGEGNSLCTTSMSFTSDATCVWRLDALSLEAGMGQVVAIDGLVYAGCVAAAMP